MLETLTKNVKINAKHVPGKFNKFADLLSRLKYKEFWQQARKTQRAFSKKPAQIPEILQDMKKLWIKNNSKKEN